MNKKYEYNDKIYCEDDLSEEIENYGGDLFYLYLELQKAGDACDMTIYYGSCNPEITYESYEALIEYEFDGLEVEGNEDKNNDKKQR